MFQWRSLVNTNSYVYKSVKASSRSLKFKLTLAPEVSVFFSFYFLLLKQKSRRRASHCRDSNLIEKREDRKLLGPGYHIHSIKDGKTVLKNVNLITQKVHKGALD